MGGHMEEMNDYSGPFKPDLRLQDFSKDALVRLWECGGKMYLGIAGLWYDVVKEKLGEQTAIEFSREVWLGSGVKGCDLEAQWPTEAMNIHGDDVASYFKFLQVDPGAAAIWPDYTMELMSPNRGILTIKRCLPLERYEKLGQTELLMHTCHEIEVKGFERGIKHFNSRMKVTPLKLPPRKNKSEIACRWEFMIPV